MRCRVSAGCGLYCRVLLLEVKQLAYRLTVVTTGHIWVVTTVFFQAEYLLCRSHVIQ